jgi:hypothetical protein
MILVLLLLYIGGLIQMSDMERKMFIWTFQNLDYFTWIHGKGLSATNPLYMPMCYFLLFSFVLFPIITMCIPNWFKLCRVDGLYELPLSLHNNKQLCKDVQSKMFWYTFLTDMNIYTPVVYYHSDTLINEIQDDTETFIMKPVYGTQGSRVTRVTLEEYKKHSSNNVILQKLVKDCTYDKARHFRIHTLSYNRVFGIIEKKQLNNTTASNGGNGSKNRICEHMICDFLSEPEQNQVYAISLRLATVHAGALKDLPHLGWDVCLTCDGPCVFEGNLSATTNEGDGMYETYMKTMKEFYSKTCIK